jgi:hypothetical protein
VYQHDFLPFLKLPWLLLSETRGNGHFVADFKGFSCLFVFFKALTARAASYP